MDVDGFVDGVFRVGDDELQPAPVRTPRTAAAISAARRGRRYVRATAAPFGPKGRRHRAGRQNSQARMHRMREDVMKLGLHLPDFTYPAGAGELADDLSRIAATAEDAGFARLSVMDHVWQIRAVGP